jgi:hypothetical protein
MRVVPAMRFVSDGGFDLPVDGIEKLSKDERDRLAERLK